MNSSLQVRSSLLFVLGAALAFSACPTVPDADPLEVAPSITSFTSSAAEVAVGAQVTLSWKVANATSVKIEDVKLGAVSGVTGNEGSVDVAITGESLFVLTARNDRGAADTAVVSVRVGASAGELLVTALPASIEAGQSTTLAWSAPGATVITLTANPGGAVDVGSQTSSGAVSVSPTATTTYTLTAGVRSVTTTVTVNPTLLSFTASSLSADAGSMVTLSWATANATSVRLSAPGRGTLADVTDAARVAAGTFDDVLPAVVDPGQLFAYELTVTGPGATLTRSLVVSINGNPAIVTFTAPKYVREGSDAGIALAWTTRESDAVSLAAGGIEFYRAPQTAIAVGTVTVASPAADTIYTLRASNSRGGAVTSASLVDVVGTPTVTLTATPASAMVGEPVTLAWSGTNVRNVTVTDASGQVVVFRGTDVMDTGSVPTQVRNAQNATYRITADNGAGDVVTGSVTVTVSNGVALTRAPATGALRRGQEVTLSWASTQTLYGLPHKAVTTNVASTNFDDISTTGTAITFANDYWSVTEINPTGFSAPFFGRLVGSRVWVTTNGYLSFVPTNDINYSDVALPSAKLETYAIAPAWDDITLGTDPVRWQVKPDGAGKVLIVQWTSVEMATADIATFQVKLHSTGQVDLEYQTWAGTSGNAGIQGRRANEGFSLPVPRASGLGVTYFAPVTGTANLDVTSELPLTGFIEASGQYLPVQYEVGTVVAPRDLSIAETMVTPAAAVAANGQWFEFFNTRDTALDLTGWTFELADGGSSAPLSGTVAARSVLVVGATTDRALNDDAGVQLALTGFTTGSEDAGTLTFGRSGPLSSFSWSDPSPGVAQVSDFGPYRFSGDTSSSPARPDTCAATAAYGAQGQLGSPGSDGTCGFGYTWYEIPAGYFDISGSGTPGVTGSTDSSVFNVDLSAAPFPFFGTNRSVARVSTNGFVAFGATASGTDSFSSVYPSTTDTNLLIAAFADDLDTNGLTGSQVYSKRIGANIDPAAAAPHWIIQWHHWTHWNCDDDLNFQVKLFDDGKSEIHFAAMSSASCSTQYGSGASAVTWVENATGTQALIINANSLTPGISPHSAFRISPR